MNYRILVAMLALSVALLLVVLSFRGGDRYGELRPNEAVTAAFASFRIDPGKDYYLTGSDLYPEAILGIDRSWTLETDLWKRRDLPAGGLKELVGNMGSKAMEQGGGLQGYDILDDRERKIGEGFSRPGWNVTVRIRGENRVSVSTPPARTER